jgi:hypothetical protein
LGASSRGANVEIPPWLCWMPNPALVAGTLPGGEFDWGGRLPNSNGGAQRSPQPDWKPGAECNGIRGLDCNIDRWSRCESRP